MWYVVQAVQFGKSELRVAPEPAVHLANCEVPDMVLMQSLLMEGKLKVLQEILLEGVLNRALRGDHDHVFASFDTALFFLADGKFMTVPLPILLVLGTGPS